MPTDDIAEYYRQRWAIPRSTRRHDFRDWRKENMRLSNELPNTNIQYSLATAFDTARLIPAASSSSWSVSDVSVSQVSLLTRRTGVTISGATSDGDSRDTEVATGKFKLTLTETTWDNGERDIQATDRHDSPAIVDSLIRRLRIGIYDSPLQDQLSYMELRLARPGTNGRATITKTSPAEIENVLGKPLDELLPRSMGIIVGTRAELFRDDSRRRNELCAVFPKSDAQTPVRIWVVTRLLSYIASPAGQAHNGKAIKATKSMAKRKAPPGRSKSSTRKTTTSVKTKRKSTNTRKTR
jgi:hypothetical protein